MRELNIDPVIPIWLIGLLMAGALATIWVSLGRTAPAPKHKLAVLGLRLLVLLILAVLLLQPKLLSIRQQAEPPALAILVDSSASMLDSPNRDPEIRRDHALGLLESRRFRRDAGKYRVFWYEFGRDLQAVPDPDAHDWRFDAPRSHLVEALNGIAERHRASNLAGVVVISDGLDQSTVALSPAAARIGIFAPELEQLEPPRPVPVADVLIADLVYPKMLVAGWEGQIEVLVRRSNAEQKMVVPVRLYRGEERIRQANASFEVGRDARQISFTIQPAEVGRQHYRLEIDPPEDSEPENNRRAFAIDVTDPRNRVLYIEGTMRSEFAPVKNALLRERNFQLEAYLQTMPGVFMKFSEEAGGAQTGQLPDLTAADALNYRAIILGEMKHGALNAAQQEALEAYVDKGGGLLFLGGARAYGDEGWPAAATMAKLLPFSNQPQARMRDGKFAVRPTDLGEAHPILANVAETGQLPTVTSLWGLVRVSGGAQVLVESTEGAPMVVVNRYGSGKVAAILSDSLWRWQLGAPRLTEGKSLHERFVSQLVFWLSPRERDVEAGANLQLLTASGEAEVRETVAVGAVLAQDLGRQDVTVTLTVKTPDDRRLELPMTPARLGQDLGLSRPVAGYRAEFVPREAGEYSLAATDSATGQTATTRLLVVQPRLEKTGEPIARDYLRELAERSGGAFVPVTEAEAIIERVPFDPVETRMTSERPLWNRAWILLVLLALFALEWFLRGKLDMV